MWDAASWGSRYEGERDALVTQRIGWRAGLVFACGVTIAGSDSVVLEQLGGRVDLESAPGRGSTFTIRVGGAVVRSAEAA